MKDQQVLIQSMRLAMWNRLLLFIICMLLYSPVNAEDWVPTISQENPQAPRYFSMSSQANKGGWQAIVRCVDHNNLDLRFVLKPKHKNYKGDPSMLVVRIDSDVTSITVSGAGEYGLVIDEAGRTQGMSPAWLNKLVTGKNLILDGPPVSAVPLAQRTFSLTNAYDSLRTLSIECAQLK